MTSFRSALRILSATCAAALLLLPGHAGAADTPTDPYAELHYWYPLPKAAKPAVITVDVCVYGATPAGVTAAIQATRMGKTAALVEFSRHVGGLTSSGLSATDGGNAIGGLALEFYKGLGKRRGFLPAEAEARFRAMLAEAKVQLLTEHRLSGVSKDGAALTAIDCEDGDRVQARMFVDATYEGDLLARAGVAFTVGREANAQYGETLDGVQKPGSHNFTRAVDPFVKPGDPTSGLLPGITNPAADAPGAHGAGDQRIQAYNFRMFLAKMPDAFPFPKPPAYDAGRYELLLRYLQAGAEGGPELHDFMQLHVGDSNNNGGFSTDDIGMNYAWPEADYATRETIYQEHVTYQQGLMWFLANDPRVPEGIRAKVAAYGLDKRSFPATGGWPHALYVREARRMVADYVMTEHNCRGKTVAEDAVGLGEYNMDSHNTQRFVDRSGAKPVARNEGDVQVGVPGSYPIAYRAIVPKAGTCANLLVPVCLSATHIAYGSIRMEPVFMVLGQSAGTAAVLALDGKIAVQALPYAALRARLDQDGQRLTPTLHKK
ncbi:MAG: FAD-dependent oxidoreductase [Planctomycetes bacterium]|nr:FAD-dependent oxidoreductase [Planctomycetota bacterium]